MQYNIIGDIHARENSLELLDSSCINIIVGDYFDPYFPISWETQKDIFLKIIDFKEKYPQTILLKGNHDERYKMLDYATSRYNAEHATEIQNLFNQYDNYFTLSTSINNQYLITHAGVSARWFCNRILKVNGLDNFIDGSDIPKTITNIEEGLHWLKEKQNGIATSKKGDLLFFNRSWWYYDEDWIKLEVTPDLVSSMLNDVYKNQYEYKLFDFAHNADYFDCYGTSISHGPQWIRLESLAKCNIFKGTDYIQIFGHTMSKDFQYVPNKADPKLIMIDCLGFKNKSYKIDINE